MALAFIGSLTLYFYWNDGINRILLVLSFAILLVLALLNRAFSDRTFFVIICVNLASLIVTVASHKGLGVAMLFINLLLACAVFNNAGLSRMTYIWVHLIPALMWSAFCVAAIKGSFYYGDTYLGETYWGYKCFGMIINENTIGLLSLACIFHWACAIEQMHLRKMTRLLATVIISVLPAWRIVQSGCRSVLLALLLFCVLCVFLRKPLAHRTYYFIVVGGILLSVLFALLYCMFIERLDIGEVMGRDSNSRIYIWQAAFDLIKQYPLFGSGTEIRMVMLDSAHNTVLSWMKTIGLIPTLTYVFFLVAVRKKSKNTCSRIAQAAVIAGLIIGFFESFYADSFFYMSFILFFLKREAAEDGSVSPAYFGNVGPSPVAGSECGTHNE